MQGIHINASGNITNIDTSGLVTTDDFNVLLSKKVNFDSGGHITNISTSGLVTESSFAQMFSEKAYADGYVKRAEISTFITEDQAGRLISNAVISAEQIRFNGNIVANDTFVVDENGKLTLNNITVNETGEFKGRVSIANKILLENDGSGSLASGNITWDDKGLAEFVGTIKSSSSSGGNYVVIGVEKLSNVPGAEDNGLKIYDEQGNQVGAFGYITGFGMSGAMGMVLQDSNERIIIRSSSLYLQSASGGNIYSVEISPSSGIKFYENFNLTKTYSRK